MCSDVCLNFRKDVRRASTRLNEEFLGYVSPGRQMTLLQLFLHQGIVQTTFQVSVKLIQNFHQKCCL